jgi:hypothetical protein
MNILWDINIIFAMCKYTSKLKVSTENSTFITGNRHVSRYYIHYDWMIRYFFFVGSMGNQKGTQTVCAT